MKKVLLFLYSLYALILFFILMPFLVLFYLVMFILPISKRKQLYGCYNANQFVMAIWLFLVGIRTKVSGWEKVNPNETYVFVGNHVNMLDIVLYGRHFKFNGKPLAKKEIRNVPLLGQLFQIVAILVDRSNKESREEAVSTMLNNLKKGISIVLYPEGTRNRSSFPLKTFHKGGFRIAIAAGVPVVLITQLHSRNLQPVDTWYLKPGTLHFKILDVIPTTGMGVGDIDYLAIKCYDLLEKDLLENDDYWRIQGKPSTGDMPKVK